MLTVAQLIPLMIDDPGSNRCIHLTEMKIRAANLGKHDFPNAIQREIYRANEASDQKWRMVGAVRFELTTSCTRNKRASQATLRPEPRWFKVPGLRPKSNPRFHVLFGSKRRALSALDNVRQELTREVFCDLNELCVLYRFNVVLACAQGASNDRFLRGPGG